MNALTWIAVITVRLYEAGALPQSQLRTGTEVATATLTRAGITLQWVRCSPGTREAQCGAPLGPGELVVRVAQGPGTGTGAGAGSGDRRKTPAPACLGDALVDRVTGAGTLATVYADRVREASRGSRVDEGALLGHAMAHEIGHLLLGSIDHAPAGLMRAQWSSIELQRGFKRDWQFSSADVAALHGRLGAGRHAAARGAN